MFNHVLTLDIYIHRLNITLHTSIFGEAKIVYIN